MVRKERVGGKELTAMLTLFVATNTFLTYPRFVSQIAYESAWMIPVLSGVLTLVVFLLVERILSVYFPGMDIVQVSRETFGRWPAICIAMIFAAYLLFNTASTAREFSENVITSVLPNTPILIVESVFMLTVGYIAYVGLEGICRTSFLMLPVLLIGTLGLCVLTANWWEPRLLLPFWGKGIVPVVYGSVKYSAIFANVLLLCIIFPLAHDPRAFRRIGIGSILISTLLLVAFIVTYHMVFPPTETGKSTFALYQMTRMIDLGRFVQRLESIFVFLWVTAATIKMGVTLWGAAYLLGKALDWPTYKPGIASLGLLAFVFSLWPENLIEVIRIDEQFLMSYGWLIVFGLPLFVVLCGVLRHYIRQRPRGGPSSGRRWRRRRQGGANPA